MRQYALDYGGDGIRANAVNADRIRSGLLTDDMIAAALQGTRPQRGRLHGRQPAGPRSDRRGRGAGLRFAGQGAEDDGRCITTVDGGNIAAACVRGSSPTGGLLPIETHPLQPPQPLFAGERPAERGRDASRAPRGRAGERATRPPSPQQPSPAARGAPRTNRRPAATARAPARGPHGDGGAAASPATADSARASPLAGQTKACATSSAVTSRPSRLPPI